MNHEDISNHSDDNTPYVSRKNIDKVVRFLEESSHVTFKCFSDSNQLLETDNSVSVHQQLNCLK